MKNIPTPDDEVYKLKLISKIEAVIKRMRWKMYWIENKEETNKISPETFGFKSRNTPPPCDKLVKFESDLLDLFEKVEFRYVNDKFQKKLKKDISEIRNSDKVFVFADKTSNIYKMSPDSYNKLLKENVTKTYKKAPVFLESSINKEAKCISKSYNVDNRAEILAKSSAFISLKDHKDNFEQKLPCRLINPCKSEIGAISKTILDRVNSRLRHSLQVNQWKNTSQVTEWFSNIDDKKSCKFVQFDIKEFYPSITKEILNKAIEFATKHTSISVKEIRTIQHCRKSLLFFNDEAWKKKQNHECFDVTMGSFDGAEICELVGIYILQELSLIIDKSDSGLYRDDGLMVLRNTNKQDSDRIRKKIINSMKQMGFDIEIIMNLKKVNFLDVTLDLTQGTYQPFKKPNDQLLYVHESSNHPKNILKQLPISINDRLIRNSSNEEVFNNAKGIYEEALQKSGYKAKLSYNNNQTNRHHKKKNRKRNIIWFNPPFNKNVKTDIARSFLKLIEKHFTVENNLRKIFNKNNVKVSYSCTENVKSIINTHNRKLTSLKPKETPPCNCRKKSNCPLPGKCREKSIVYKCEVSCPNLPTKVYIGLTEKELKERISGHKSSFNDRKYKNSTTLSKYIWDLKDQNLAPSSMKWSIIKRVSAYTNKSKSCPLCLQEKLEILRYENKKELLNKRSEIVSKCRHENKFMLANYKSKD